VSVCPQCGERNPARFRYCGKCATPLAALLAREVRKFVSVVVCDLVSSTAMGERLDPESVRQVQSRFYAEMREAIERHGGWVEKYIGDAVVGLFGVPILHEDDALRAVSAAAEMRERLVALNLELEREWGARLRTRTGVNSGEAVAEREVFLGQVFVAGDTMNVAARLEQAAGGGEILIGEQTYALVRDSVQAVPVAPLTLKGKSEPVPAWRLLSVTAPHGRRREFDSPLVGRGAELARLAQELARTRREGAARLVTILGSAGLGKSRLAHEFVAALGGGATVLQGRCVPYGDGITFWPIADVVRHACGIAPGDSAEESRSKLAGQLPANELHAVVCDRLAGVLGLGETESATVETFWAIRKLLEELARPRPLVLVLDDVHWAEETFVELVEDLALRLQAPVLLLCLARPELLEHRPPWLSDREDPRVLLLEPLGPGDGASLLAGLLGGVPLAEEAASRLIRAAAGNPLFLEELVRMLIDERLLRHEGDAWIGAADLSTIAVPPSLRALLGARLDRLEPAARQVIETASVVGEEFTRGAIAGLVPPNVRRRVDALLEALLSRGLLRSGAGADELRFHHILIRDVAYESMPKRARAELHARYAALLEAEAGDRLPEQEEVVGFHLEQAFRLREQLGPIGADTRTLGLRAGRHLASSGRRASGRGDVPGALHLLRRALALLPEDDPGSHQVMLELGVSLMQTGDARASDELLTRAIDLAAARGDRRLESYARIERSGLRVDVQPELGSEPLRAEAEAALTVFEALADESGLAKAWRRLATVDGVNCRWGAAGDGFERALAHARRANDAREEALASALIFYCLVLGPTPVGAAIERCDELLAERGNHRSVEAVGLAALANLQAMVGRFDDARRLLSRSETILEDLGQTRRLVETAFRAAETEMLAGDPGAAERKLAWAYSTVEPTGQRGYLASIAAALAEPLEALGRYDEASEMTIISEAAAAEDDPDAQVKWRQVRAKLCARRGDHDTAALLAHEAVERAAATDALNMQAAALADLAAVLDSAGLLGDARAAADRALELYVRKGNRVGDERTRRLLGRLHPRGAGARRIGA
jgi:class 3 adenylate cyclase/tetratricopeptide (TPR) repeat protein